MAQTHRDIDSNLNTFLKLNGCSTALSFVAGDASPRTYYRVSSEAESRILMISEDEKSKNDSFLKIAKILKAEGFRAPQIYAEDFQNGFYLLEDLGDLTFNRALQEGISEKDLYQLGIKGLIEIHNKFQDNSHEIPSYNFDKFYEEASLLIDWYAPEVLKKPVPEEARNSYKSLWKNLYDAQPHLPQTLVLRDYMVDNLMWIPEEIDIQKLGILDFQDALWGPITYDLVSLLEEVRRDVDPHIVQKMLEIYLTAYPYFNVDDFYHSYYLWGAQRNSKIIGIFMRLAKRDGKTRYIDFIPRVWRLLENDLNHPALTTMKNWFEENLPTHLRVRPL
ncbi:Phosphotransferase enzyme family protein [Candidatus Bealeia paramacronuclearis]|uniref:Phosphotransferase enzyme family protein n=1 Tax=Candidatus Bealeia paramacronuclearis TaxID=1921001 RepID=A0ABZ2C495_9PROT|nr:Phosphotransferase enzyme family protein [Candidatus Bealeia paramacronuclearis]